MNPSEVSDRMLAPSIASNPPASASFTPPLSDDQIEKRYQEGYDLHDPQYEWWVKENHPSSSDTDSLNTHVSHSCSDEKANTHTCDLSEILKYPEEKSTSRKKPGINSSAAVCISDSPVIQQLKQKEELQEEKLRKKEEREKRIGKEKAIEGERKRRKKEEKDTEGTGEYGKTNVIHTAK